MNCKFEFYYCNYELALVDQNAKWPQKEIRPQILMAGQISKKVYYLMSGMIHIMDKNGIYEYGIIHEGSYFGDISAIFDEPNEYSFCYNPYSERSIQLLAIDADDFIKICRSYPCSFEVVLQRAYNKKFIYQSYKSIILLSFMKQLQKQPPFLRRKLLEGKTIQERIKTMISNDIKLDLYRSLVEQFHLARIYSITWNLEQMLNQDMNCSSG